MTLRDCLRLTHDAATVNRKLTRSERLAISELRGRYLELKRIARERPR